MNLISRSFGIGLYFIALIIFCNLISKAKDYKQIKKILNIYLLILCTFGFCFKPNTGNDLYRITEILHIFANDSKEMIIYRITNSSTPIELIYYYTIAKIGIDGLLPALTAFISYKIIFNILIKYTKKTELNGKTISITLLIIMSNSAFMLCISNIRTVLMISIFSKCLYEEYYENKNIIKNLPSYIIASLIHNMGVIVVGLRFACFLFEKNSKNQIISLMKKTFIIITMLILTYYYKDIIIRTMDKANSYLSGGSYDYFWENIITCLEFILLFFLQHKSKKSITKNKNIYKLLLIFNTIIILFCTEHSIFTRFTTLLLFISIPIIADGINHIIYTKKNKEEEKLIVIYTILILIISCARGNLCSLKFW